MADASHDEIKRAYLERALEHHPDRQSAQTPEARERAEFHMRELNQAWEVLRSPGRRAEYDMRLRGTTPVWQERTARAKRTTPVSARVADLEPEAAGSSRPARQGLRLGPIVLIVVVVVSLLAFAAWANSSSSDSDRDVAVEAGTPFETDACVVLVSLDGRFTPVPGECSAVGALRIETIVDLGRPCPSETQPFDLQPEEQRLCLRPST